VYTVGILSNYDWAAPTWAAIVHAHVRRVQLAMAHEATANGANTHICTLKRFKDSRSRNMFDADKNDKNA